MHHIAVLHRMHLETYINLILCVYIYRLFNDMKFDP